ncbi:Golgi transport complex subunit 6 [Cryomyces antarcticus]|uniref:Golgi transport complex subunit 6 n=1 Tax=Cryomyces antarcticus TaxID=329879 RepID=A0ABR0LUK6_9PEZI|nr:Golgi transport complex subunit 6 [Cryomyces antarcticus]
MRDHVSSVQGGLAVAPSDLDVPRFLTEALDTLAALMKSYDTSLAPSSSSAEREAGFQPVLAEALDPFLHGFTRQRMQTLDDAIAQHAARLVEYQHVWFLHASGLQPLVSALASLSSSSADLPPVFAPGKLVATSRHLDAFLPSAMEDARENVKRLKSAALALEVTEAAAERFCEDFEAVEDVVLKADEERRVADVHADGGEGAGRLREVFPRTSAEIRVLLS